MEDERDLPADQAAADEVDRIYKDQSHPQHAPFWKNDRAAVEYRDRLLARAWPLKDESGADPVLDNPGILAKSERTPGQLEPQPTEPLAKSAEQLSPEDQQVNQEAALALYERHGDRTGAIIARATNIAQYLETTSPLYSRVCKAALAKGITKDVMIEILDDAGIEYGFDDKQRDET